MNKFSAKVHIVDSNPYVEIPDDILRALQKQAGKEKSPLPVKGTLQGISYIQTVVKFRDVWRLYLNTPMRHASKTEVGDRVMVEIAYDSVPRNITMPKQLAMALRKNKYAKISFENLPPYRQKEIKRYLSSLKSSESLQRNIKKLLEVLASKKAK